MSSATCLNLDQSKILSSGNGMMKSNGKPPGTEQQCTDKISLPSRCHKVRPV